MKVDGLRGRPKNNSLHNPVIQRPKLSTVGPRVTAGTPQETWLLSFYLKPMPQPSHVPYGGVSLDSHLPCAIRMEQLEVPSTLCRLFSSQ